MESPLDLEPHPRGLFQLLLAQGSLRLPDGPLMPKRIGELTIAVAPELVSQRHRHSHPTRNRPLPEAIHICHLQMNRHRRPAERLWRRRLASPHLREIIRKHDASIADHKMSMRNLG